VNLKVLRHYPLSKFLELQIVEKTKFNDSYLSLGFTYAGDETVLDTQCVLCNKVLPNSSSLPPNLANTVVLITLNIRTNTLVFSSVSLRH
jgi:hypothetical protein